MIPWNKPVEERSQTTPSILASEQPFSSRGLNTGADHGHSLAADFCSAAPPRISFLLLLHPTALPRTKGRYCPRWKDTATAPPLAPHPTRVAAAPPLPELSMVLPHSPRGCCGCCCCCCRAGLRPPAAAMAPGLSPPPSALLSTSCKDSYPSLPGFFR